MDETQTLGREVAARSSHVLAAASFDPRKPDPKSRKRPRPPRPDAPP